MPTLWIIYFASFSLYLIRGVTPLTEPTPPRDDSPPTTNSDDLTFPYSSSSSTTESSPSTPSLYMSSSSSSTAATSPSTPFKLPDTTTTTTSTTTSTTTAPVTTTTTTAQVNTTTTTAPITTTSSSSCNSSIFVPIGSTQTLTTPNYPSNYNTRTTCIYSISATSGYAILVVFNAFSLEGSTYCNYDYLQVYDGSSSSANLLGQYCGTTAPTSTTSSSNTLHAVFNSDYSIVSFGISATLPSIAAFLQKRRNCSLKQAAVTRFLLESDDGCLHISGSSSSANLLGQYCGSSAPTSITSSSNTLYALFNSDYSIVSFGISATLPSIAAFQQKQAAVPRFLLESDDGCLHISGSSSSANLLGQYCGSSAPTSITSSSNTLYALFNSDNSIVSSGISATLSVFDNSYPGCKLAYTEYAAITTVQTFSSSTSGTTGLYPSNTDEYFLVTKADASVSLILQLSAMNVEKATNCIYDRIVIYDGGCTSFSVLHTHCGTYLARWELSGNEYLVHFHTDASVQKSGFTMQYYTGVAGTGAPTTTTTTIGPPVSEEILLVNNVLTNYTAVNSPRRDFSVAITSTVNLALVGINGLDEVEQALTTTVSFDISWKDDYMEWLTTKAGGISSLLIPQNDVWKPDITLMNGVEKITQMGASFMFVQVLSNGTCKWKPYQILKSTCNTGMSKYPYDIQTCKLKFSTWSSSGSDVTTVIGPDGMAKHADFVENSEWTLLDITQSTEVTDGKNVAVFTLRMQRNQRFVVFYINIPVAMLSLLNVFTFALPVTSGEKSGFGMTVFLSFVVYLIVTFQKLPDNSDSLSLFAVYLLLNSMLSAITVMISCLEIRMITLTTKHRPLGSLAIKFSTFFGSLQMRMLRVHTSVEAIGNKQTDPSIDGELEDVNAWPNFVSALDFVCFFVFSGITVFLMLFFMVYLAV